jgi:hypothetical protein
MIRKIIVLGVLVIFLFLPVPSFAQKLGGSVNSIDDIKQKGGTLGVRLSILDNLPARKPLGAQS